MRPIFPMKYLNITQGHRGGTHKAGFPIDIAGKDTGIDDVFAPFDGMINKIFEPNNSALGHTVWLESLAPVTYADGTVDFATVMLTHDNAVTDLRVGQIVKQGQVFYQEGTAGFATGNHVHLEVARGKMAGLGWQQVNGSWIITNPYEPHKMFFLSDTIIINGFGYPWKDKALWQTGATMNENGVRFGYLAVTGGIQPEAADVKYWTGRDPEEFTKNLYGQSDFYIVPLRAENALLKAQLAVKPEPIEIIKEIRMPVELDGLSVGELLSAVWAKLFKIK